MLAKTLVVAEILPDFERETAFLMLKIKGKEAHGQRFKAHCPLFRAIQADFRENFTVEGVLIPFFFICIGKVGTDSLFPEVLTFVFFLYFGSKNVGR